MKKGNLRQTWIDIKSIISLLKSRNRAICWILVLEAIMSAAQPFVSLYFSAEILDDILRANYQQTIWHVTWLLGMNLVLGLSQKICEQTLKSWEETLDEQVEMNTVGKAYRMEFEELEKQETIDAIGRIKQSKNSNGGLISMLYHIKLMLRSTVSCLLSFAFMIQLFMKTGTTNSFYDGPWPVVMLFGFYAIMFGLTHWLNVTIKKTEYRLRKDNEHGNALFGYFFGFMFNYRNGKDIRMYQMSPLLMDRMKKNLHPIMKMMFEMGHKGGLFFGTQSFLLQISSWAAFLFVCGKVIAGSISIGSVFLYTGAINRISENLNAISSSWSAFYYQMQYLKEYQHFIDRPNMHYDGTLPIEKRTDMRYELSFENVTFCYPGTDQPVLKNVSFKFEIGRRYALVGRNGAGKSTLIKLLCRLYEPTEGRILLNGIDIGLYDYDEYVQIFSVVFQDFKLFAFPLGENIAGSQQVDERRARKSLEQAGMAERLEILPEGLDTLLYHNTGEGIDLSGGEAQKVAIARALYKDAPFVILDEPTAALDPLAEAEVYTHFNDLIQNKTAIYISHRMSSCQFCDEILVLDDGQIAEQGDHAALLEQGGLYAELYQTQAVHYQ